MNTTELEKLEYEIENNADQYVSSFKGFETLIKKVLENNIRMTPLLGRVRYDSKNRKPHNFDYSKITLTYRNDIKDKILKIKDKVDYKKFEQFKDKYRAIPFSKNNVLSMAQSIKNTNPNMLDDISNFLLDNGIILLALDKPNDDFMYLDGFACFLDRQPIIVVYNLSYEDRRRMFFTIGHELYHLLYDENEQMADKFAGSFLLTNNDINNVLDKLNIDRNSLESDNIDNLKNIFQELYVNNVVSMRSIMKSLINYGYLNRKDEDHYKFLENFVNSKIKTGEINPNTPIIQSTEFLLN